MKSKLLFSKILSYCSSPKLESSFTSGELDQSLISQSLKVTSKGLESVSNEKPNMPALFQAVGGKKQCDWLFFDVFCQDFLVAFFTITRSQFPFLQKELQCSYALFIALEFFKVHFFKFNVAMKMRRMERNSRISSFYSVNYLFFSNVR